MTESPPSSDHLVAGLDLGSTGIKIVVTDLAGRELVSRQRPTPWRAGPAGSAELDPGALLDALAGLFADADRQLRSTGSAAPVAAVAISGMGETGVVIDRHGNAVAPGFAWFDPRGADEVAALPEQLRVDFSGRTGLPLGAQVSVAKLLHLRASGMSLAGLRWLNLPEFVAAQLGAEAASEYSLASRTGLLDQDSGRPWSEMLVHLGVGESFLPPLVDAGCELGSASAGWLPRGFAGAAVTVAGHDHLVSSVSAGAGADDRYHVSMGTAEVLLRIRDRPVPFEERRRLAGYLINCVRHVVPGQFVVVAGVKTGLLMRRALTLCGISDRPGRDALDDLVQAAPLAGDLPVGAVEIRGARNDDGVLSITVHGDGVTPTELFGAILRHGNSEIRRLIDAMDQTLTPARATVLSGGWASMRSVQRARSEVLPEVSFSPREQDTAYGATLFARQLLQQRTGATYLSSSPQGVPS